MGVRQHRLLSRGHGRRGTANARPGRCHPGRHPLERYRFNTSATDNAGPYHAWLAMIHEHEGDGVGQRRDAGHTGRLRDEVAINADADIRKLVEDQVSFTGEADLIARVDALADRAETILEAAAADPLPVLGAQLVWRPVHQGTSTAWAPYHCTVGGGVLGGEGCVRLHRPVHAHPLRVRVHRTLRLSGGAFAPGEKVTVRLAGVNRVLATLKATGDGTLRLRVRIPTTRPGRHRLLLRGERSAMKQDVVVRLLEPKGGDEYQVPADTSARRACVRANAPPHPSWVGPAVATL